MYMNDEIEKIASENLKQSTEIVNAPGLLTTEQAATWLGYKPRMLEARRLRGGGPLYIRISARSVRYRLEDLQRWINSRICSSTSTVISNQ
jgi:predicted DNA-binding transcriptional regulator AlpA